MRCTLLTVLLGACAASEQPPDIEAADPSARSDASVAPAPDARSPTPRDASPSEARCPGLDTSEHIYVLAHGEGLEVVLWRFAPRTSAFERVGVVSCGSADALGDFPISFAIARDGTAWVLHGRGVLDRLDLSDASCEPTGMVLPDPYDAHFMAFSSDVPGGTTETLFATSFDGGWFGTLSLESEPRSTTLGALGTLRGSRVMITGTADASLWAISQATVGDPEEETAVLSRIDPATGGVLTTRELEAPLFVHSGRSAFAFWGGDFWMFTNGSGRPGAVVSRFRVADGSLEEVATHTTMAPIGVAVSTCVPVDLI